MNTRPHCVSTFVDSADPAPIDRTPTDPALTDPGPVTPAEFRKLCTGWLEISIVGADSADT